MKSTLPIFSKTLINISNILKTSRIILIVFLVFLAGQFLNILFSGNLYPVYF